MNPSSSMIGIVDPNAIFARTSTINDGLVDPAIVSRKGLQSFGKWFTLPPAFPVAYPVVICTPAGVVGIVSNGRKVLGRLSVGSRSRKP